MVSGQRRLQLCHTPRGDHEPEASSDDAISTRSRVIIKGRKRKPKPDMTYLVNTVAETDVTP